MYTVELKIKDDNGQFLTRHFKKEKDTMLELDEELLTMEYVLQESKKEVF